MEKNKQEKLEKVDGCIYELIQDFIEEHNLDRGDYDLSMFLSENKNRAKIFREITGGNYPILEKNISN